MFDIYERSCDYQLWKSNSNTFDNLMLSLGLITKFNIEGEQKKDTGPNFKIGIVQKNIGMSDQAVLLQKWFSHGSYLSLFLLATLWFEDKK